MANDCSNCGTPSEPDDRFCGECGNEISQTLTDPNAYVESGEVVSEYMGELNDLDVYMRQLMDHSTPWDKLVVDLLDSDDFLQYMFTENIVQLDFPMVTERQKLLSPKAFSILSDLNFFPFMAETVDHAQLLACDLTGSSLEIAEASTTLARELYGSDRSSKSKYILIGDNI